MTDPDPEVMRALADHKDAIVNASLRDLVFGKATVDDRAQINYEKWRRTVGNQPRWADLSHSGRATWLDAARRESNP